jgi:hypothetical protein
MTSDRERVENAVELLSRPEAEGLLREALKQVCRERPEWWLRFLRKEQRIQHGGRGFLA